METKKPWWQSRTIWLGLAAAIAAVLSAAGVLPETVTDAYIDKIVTGALWAATLIYRVVATKSLTVVADAIDTAAQADTDATA